VEWLSTVVLPHGGQVWVAGLLGLTPRTLQEWMRQMAPAREPGRPAHTASERWQALLVVARACREQGEGVGWRVLKQLLTLPRRLIVEALGRWKLRWRRRDRRRKAVNRLSLRVEARDVLWSQDSTQVGRVGNRKVKAQVVKEAASGRTLLALVEAQPSTGSDVVAQLHELKQQRGRLPLIWATDNGPEYISREVETWLAAEQVVALRNVPRTPEHNARAERGIGELKRESGLGNSVRLSSPAEAQERLQVARRRLDARRVRERLGWRTAEQADSSAKGWYGLVRRRSFYAAACSAIGKAVLGARTLVERRKAERKAILQTAASFGLVTITRGGVLLDAGKREGVL
jgi:transposase InsO family protein